MELEGKIEIVDYAPRYGTDSTIMFDVKLDNVDEIASIKETNNEATLIKKYGFTVEHGNEYDTSSMTGRRCLIFRNNDGDAFSKYLD